MKSVYLAGPITGLSFAGCDDWRHAAVAKLKSHGIQGLSPTRSHEHLAELEVISGHGKEYSGKSIFTEPRGVMTRDRFDVQRCDVVLLNLIGAKRVSIGSMIEIGWADAYRKPIVCVMEDDGSNLHEHMMLTEAIGFRVTTLEDGINAVASILL